MSEEIEVGVGDKKLKVTGDSLNLFFTIIGVVMSAVVAWVLYTHTGDAKEAQKEFVGAIKEQTMAMREGTAVNREQTCLLKFDPTTRQGANADFCKQISGSR